MTEFDNSKKGIKVEENTFLFRNRFVLLALIAALAFGLRAYHLSSVPPGLQIDEASIAWNAALVGETGMDEHGTPHPFYPQSTWNPKHPVYFYVSYISVKIFGLNETGARAASVFFGLLTVIATYLLAMELFGSAAAALMSAFLLAISPWHVHFSRLGFEAISFPCVFTIGLWLLLKGVRRSSVLMLPGAFFVGLSFYSYPVSLAFVPLFMAGFLFIYRKQFKEKFGMTAAALALLAVMYLPMVTGMFTDTGMTDYYQGDSISGPLVQAKIEHHLRGKGGSFYNWVADTQQRRTVYGFVTNYLGYLGPDFLVLEGDTVSIIHKPAAGMVTVPVYCLAVFAVVAILLGLVREKETRLLLLWLLLFPVGASLMRWGEQHAIRSIIAMPCCHIIAAFIMMWLCGGPFFRAKEKSPKLMWGAAVMVLSAVIFSAMSFDYYFREYPAKAAAAFNYGFKEAFGETERGLNSGEIKSVVVSQHIHYVYTYVFFYNPPFPDGVVRGETGEIDIDATAGGMGYSICDIRQCMESVAHPAMVVARPGQLPEGVYKKRNAPGSFFIKHYKTIGYDENTPTLELAIVDTVKSDGGVE